MTSMSSWREKALPSISLALATVLLSMITGLLAAVPLRALMRISGRKVYWTFSLIATGLLIAAKAFVPALFIFTLVILIGSFSEYERSGDSLPRAAACAILTTLAGWALGFMGLWSIFGKQSLWIIKTRITQTIDKTVAAYFQIYQGAELTAADVKSALFTQTPSILLMSLMAALFLAVLFEKRVVGLFQAKIKAPTYRLVFFKVHDVVIWAFIFSLLGSFTVYDNELLKAVSINTLYVCLMLLFFQGLAVTAHFFQVTRLGTPWRIFWYLLLIVYLTLSLSILGLMDYWLNFRLRVSRRAAELRKSERKIGEEK